MVFKKNIFLVLLFLLVVFSAISTSFAADLNVSDVGISNDLTINDNNGEVLVNSESNLQATQNSKTFNDIQNLIDNAEEGSTVTLENTTYYGMGENIAVVKKLTIDGKGATLDAKNLSRIFEVTVDGVVFKNINFINGNAIYGLNETQMVNYGQGGAIYFNIQPTTVEEYLTSDAYVYNCRFENNTAYVGGATYLGYIVASYFVNNVGYGGGACSLSTLNRCTFVNNTANECGGALHRCISYNSLFEGNKVKNGTGYILNDYDESTIIYEGPFLYIESYDIYVGETVNIEAKLEDAKGNPLPGKKVAFYFEGESEYIITTDSNGIAHLSIPDVMNDLYGYAVVTEDINSSNYAIFEVKTYKKPVTITVNSVNGTFGKQVTLIAEVKDINGNIVKNENLYFNGYLANYINGKYVLNYTCDDVGNFSIPVEFDGGSLYEDCETILNLSVVPFKTNLNISVIGNYYKGTKLQVSLSEYVDYNIIVTLNFSNGENSTVIICNGPNYYYVPFAPGEYNVSGYIIDECLDVDPVENISFNITNSTSSTITVSKFTTTYNSGKTFNIVVKKGTTPLVGVKLKLKVYTGSKYKWYYVTTGTDGVAKFSASTLGIGTHKVIVYSDDNSSYFTATSKTTSIVIQKAPTTVIAPKVTNKYKKSAYFKVGIKNKASGKVISGLTIKIKVYTGNNYKTYTVKTNSKGVAQINTKSLSKGTHKVVISSSSSYYIVSYSGNRIVIK